MDMSEKIKNLRSERNLTLEQVGDFVGVGKSTVRKWEQGMIKNMRRDKISKLAQALQTTPAYLMGWDEGEQKNSAAPKNDARPEGAIPYKTTGMAPVLGYIPAGYPTLATDDILGYEPVDVHAPEECFWLIVKGDSMINAGIRPGDMVLIRQQPCAENGQIVACRLNGDEATLKRFKRSGSTVVLVPGNPAYQPRVVPKEDFESGYASIVGVVLESKRKYM